MKVLSFILLTILLISCGSIKPEQPDITENKIQYEQKTSTIHIPIEVGCTGAAVVELNQVSNDGMRIGVPVKTGLNIFCTWNIAPVACNQAASIERLQKCTHPVCLTLRKDGRARATIVHEIGDIVGHICGERS